MTANGSRPHEEQALDAVVVGAGAVGLACSWRAAQRGLRVRVLERDKPGSGATGVAAGMLAPVGEATWGEERMVEAALASHRSWPGFASELCEVTGIEPGMSRTGALHVALDPDEAAELRRRHGLMDSLGLGASWLRGRECRGLEPGLGASVFGGVSAPDEAAVDPGALVRSLRAACAAAGAEVVTCAPVIDGIWEGGRLAGVVTTDGRRHHAVRTVLAGGAWSGQAGWLPEAARPPVRPVKGQIVTLSGSQNLPLTQRIIVTERVYLVPREKGRLVVGATVEEMGFDTRVTAGGVHELLREAYRVLPDIAELELERAVAGLRPGTPDNAPMVGPGAVEGLVLATGHFRNGLLLAPLTAAGVAAHLAGGEMPAELAVADPARFAGVAS